jgi:hypothetical protein
MAPTITRRLGPSLGKSLAFGIIIYIPPGSILDFARVPLAGFSVLDYIEPSKIENAIGLRGAGVGQVGPG